MTVPALGPALPEICLAIGALAMVLYGAIVGEKATRLLEAAALALFALAIVLVLQSEGRVIGMNGAIIIDGFARFMKVLTLIGSAAAIIMSSGSLKRDGTMRFEYPILIVLSTIGMLMMISANDLISLYVGLELQSLALYVIAAFDRDNPKSSEAGLKYFVLGALSSGMLLYGSSLVYGFTGTIAFPGIAEAMKGGIGLGLVFGLVFIAAGLAFKISAVPFHMWTPDVYEGSPTAVTAFFAAAPKMAAMAMTVRVF
ncbi:MAG: NADH-quinone oxidoreductase subunit N, partial [Bosea sp. (in: a-proteobacteria)]